MAYLDFQDLGGATIGRRTHEPNPTPDPVPAGADRLTALEWSVVAIARTDGRSSLRPPGRIATALRVLFRQANLRLADARLEALRRMAVLSWRHGYSVPSREVSAFLDAGFTPAQYETMVNRISATALIPARTVNA